MFKNILTGICITVIVLLGYLYKTESNSKNLIEIDRNKYKRMSEYSDSLLQSRNEQLSQDSTYIMELESKLIGLEYSKNKIRKELTELKASIDTISIDSIGTYIITNFEGDDYFIHKVNDSTYISIQEVTGRDIVKRDTEFKALNRLFKAVSEESSIKDSIIMKRAEMLDIAVKTGDIYKDVYEDAIRQLEERDLEIYTLNKDLDRFKKIAFGSVVLNGVLITIIILL